MSETAWIVLGSSAGMPQAGRVSSGYLLKSNNDLYLFDCGGGVSHSFRKSGFDPLAVKKIFISHTHSDHCSDLALFVQMNYLFHRAEPLEIYLPAEAVNIFKSYFNAVYLFPEKFPCDIIFKSVEEGQTVQDSRISVRPILNSHFNHNRELIEQLDLPNRMQCFSYLIQCGGRRILYSSDLGSESDIMHYLDDLDLLVIETTHIDLKPVLEAAVNKKIKRVLLTHIDEDFHIEPIREIAAKIGFDNLVLATDGLQIEL